MIPPLPSSATFNTDLLGWIMVNNEDNVNNTIRTMAISINRSFMFPSAKMDKNTPKIVMSTPHNKADNDTKMLFNMAITPFIHIVIDAIGRVNPTLKINDDIYDIMIQVGG